MNKKLIFSIKTAKNTIDVVRLDRDDENDRAICKVERQNIKFQC
jgi:hypothetical protein